MYFEEETICTVMKVSLSPDEYKILKCANDLIEKIWKKLDEADNVDRSARTVYNAIDTMGDSLVTIMENVYIE